MRRVQIGAEFFEKREAAFGDFAAVIGEHKVALGAQRIGNADAELAGEVIVTCARNAHGVIEFGRRAMARRRVLAAGRHQSLLARARPTIRGAG